MPLFEDQQRGVNELLQKLALGLRILVFQMATGGGKTVTFSAICERYILKNPDKSVLILVHREELLGQTVKTLWREYKIKAQPIAAGMRRVPGAAVYVAMEGSLKRRLNQLRQIGLVIIDECHIANFNKHIPLFPTQYIIGFSATPLSSDKKKPLKDIYQDIVCAVDIDELIKRGRLVQNITRAPADVVDRASLAVNGSDFNYDKMGQAFSKPKYVKNTIHAYEKWAKGTKTIVFNCNVAHSLTVLEAFKAAGYMNVKHLDGETPKQERKYILKWFASTRDAILLNVGVATTGFDEPTTETVIVNLSTQSLPRWLQMTGRGGRVSPGKGFFNIIDMGGNGLTHGDWCTPRDWRDIFLNPLKPGKTGGTPPVRECPQCRYILPIQTRICPDCGYVFPLKKTEDETLMDEYIVLTKNINVNELVERHRHRKALYVFYEMGREMAQQAKNTMPDMTDERAEFILQNYRQKILEWGHASRTDINHFHDKESKRHLYNELEKLFPKWEKSKRIPVPVIQHAAPPSPPDPPPLPPPPPAGPPNLEIKMPDFLQPLKIL